MKTLKQIKIFKNKKFLKILGISLAVVAVIGLSSSIMVNTFMNVHKCKVSKVISYDSSGHYYKCIDNLYCNKKFQLEKHNLEWVIDKEEECETNGYKHRECDCGYRTNVGTVIDNFKYDLNIMLDNSIQFDTFNQEWESGYAKESLSKNLEVSSNEDSRNFSMKVRYYMSSRLKDGVTYRNSNIYNANIVYISNSVSFYDELNIPYEIMLYIDYRNEVPYALDILKDGVRYRLFSEEINALAEDYISNGYLDIEFGVYQVEDSIYVFGFKLQTKNKEITYLSDNSGTIKSETMFFKCGRYTSMSGTEYSFDTILGWLQSKGIQINSDTNSIAIIESNMYSDKYDFGSLVSNCYPNSTWFLNQVKYMQWKNR